jgi:hypothetical protein
LPVLPDLRPDLEAALGSSDVEAESVWRSYIQRNCRYFSFRASVSGLGFGPRVSRLLHLVASTSSTPLCVLPELHNCTQLHNIRITQASCLNCYLLRMQHEAEVPSAETWWSTTWSEGRNRGPK